MNNQLMNGENEPLVFNEAYMSLWILLDQTRDVISKARELELNQYHLTRAHATVLHILIRSRDGMTISEIANWNLRELHSVLTLVNRMAKVGLVKKLFDRETGKIKVVVTDVGRKAYAEASIRSVEMIFTSINEDEKKQLRSILQKLRLKGRELLGIGFKPPFLP